MSIQKEFFARANDRDFVRQALWKTVQENVERCRKAQRPSFLCLSQESSRHAPAEREESFQPKDLGWLDSCDKHRNEGAGNVVENRELCA